MGCGRGKLKLRVSASRGESHTSIALTNKIIWIVKAGSGSGSGSFIMKQQSKGAQYGNAKDGSGSRGLSLLHIIMASGSVFLLFYCFWAVSVSHHAFDAIDGSSKMSAPNSASVSLNIQGQGQGQPSLENLGKFMDAVIKADDLVKEHKAQAQLRSSTSASAAASKKESKVKQNVVIGKDTPFKNAIVGRSSDTYTPLKLASKDLTGAKITPSGAVVRDVVLGMAQETDPKNIIVFCASLRAVSNADVIIFVNSPIPAQHQEIADKYRVTLMSYDLSSFSQTLQKFHPSTLRWGMMHEFLSKEAVYSKYAHVLMIDVRDSYFQSDPFAILPESEQESFLVFKGVEDKSIRSCGWNGKWVEDCFSKSTYEAVVDNNIICSGVSIGTMSSVRQYLALMSGTIAGTMGGDSTDGSDSTVAALGSKFPACERNGVDQGVHNVLVYKKLIPHMSIHDHKNGLVANLQAHLSTFKGITVSNKAGKQVAIVHQYDRNAELQQRLFKKFVYWVDTDNPVAEWNFEPACTAFGYKDNFDQFKGVCDMKMQGGATSAASCCKYCSNLSGCKGFTYYSAKCFLKSCKMASGSAGPLSGAVSGFLLA